MTLGGMRCATSAALLLMCALVLAAPARAERCQSRDLDVR